VPQDVGRQIKTFDTILYDIPNKTIKAHVPLKLGNNVVVTHGSNVGFSGQLYEVVWTLKRRQSIVAIKRNDEAKRTILNYVMAVGIETPVIKIAP
jgi:small subunit ribosomal protein S4e